jgi:hypothetical protein
MAESTGILLLNAEDNSESGLTIKEEGSNNFSITTGAALHGTYGYNFAFDGTNNELHAIKSFTAGVDIYARCYFYIPSAFSMNASYLSLLALRDNTSNYACYLRLSYSGSTLTTNRFYYRTNAGTSYVNLTNTISRDVLHVLEMRYKSGSGDGAVELWLDNTSIASASALTNNNYQASSVRMGNTEAGVPTSSSAFYMDDIKVDSSRIGAYADLSGGGSLVGASALVGGGVLCGQGNLIN